MNGVEENIYPIQGYLSYDEDANFDFSDSATELTYNSASNLRSNFYSELMDILSKDLSHPSLFKITGGILADSPFTAIGIAISSENEGVLQATITGISSSIATSSIAVTLISPAIATAGLTGAAAFATSLLAIGLTGYIVDNLSDIFYDNFIEEHIANTEISIESNSLTLNTTMTNFNDLKNLASIVELLEENENNEIDDFAINQLSFEGELLNTYTVKTGDTIWGISDKTGVSYDELRELNPWLEDRFSDDGEYVLIKVGEKLVLPDYVDMGSRAVGEVVEWYEKAQEVVQVVDPLMMDLDGDGVIATTGVEDGIYFDHKGDGFMERSSWVGGDDEMLVYDKNGSGVIDFMLLKEEIVMVA